MKSKEFEKSVKINMKAAIDYAEGGIVSKTVLKKQGGSVTLFAFGENQSLSEHTAPYDALAEILDGKAKIIIEGADYVLDKGESIIMPANVPHAVEAVEKFKMSLIMIK